MSLLHERHQIIGHYNPRCARCGRSLIDLARRPQVPCRAKTAKVAEVRPVASTRLIRRPVDPRKQGLVG